MKKNLLPVEAIGPDRTKCRCWFVGGVGLSSSARGGPQAKKETVAGRLPKYRCSVKSLFNLGQIKSNSYGRCGCTSMIPPVLPAISSPPLVVKTHLKL